MKITQKITNNKNCRTATRSLDRNCSHSSFTTVEAVNHSGMPIKPQRKDMKYSIYTCLKSYAYKSKFQIIPFWKDRKNVRRLISLRDR